MVLSAKSHLACGRHRIIVYHLLLFTYIYTDDDKSVMTNRQKICLKIPREKRKRKKTITIIIKRRLLLNCSRGIYNWDYWNLG